MENNGVFVNFIAVPHKNSNDGAKEQRKWKLYT